LGLGEFAFGGAVIGTAELEGGMHPAADFHTGLHPGDGSGIDAEVAAGVLVGGKLLVGDGPDFNEKAIHAVVVCDGVGPRDGGVGANFGRCSDGHAFLPGDGDEELVWSFSLSQFKRD
jgi:hypothetical protein